MPNECQRAMLCGVQVDKELAKCIELMAEVETAVATKKQHRYKFVHHLPLDSFGAECAPTACA